MLSGQNMSANTHLTHLSLRKVNNDRNPFVCLLAILCKAIVSDIPNLSLGQRILRAPPIQLLPGQHAPSHRACRPCNQSPIDPTETCLPDFSKVFHQQKSIRSHKNQPVALIWTLSCWLISGPHPKEYNSKRELFQLGPIMPTTP